MTSTIARAYAPPMPRRYLAPNVISMHAEDRPPVINRPRRGRYPAMVAPIWTARRLYVGAVCELRSPLNDCIPVRIVAFLDNGDAHIEAVGPRLITINAQQTSRNAGAGLSSLHRTVFRR